MALVYQFFFFMIFIFIGVLAHGQEQVQQEQAVVAQASSTPDPDTQMHAAVQPDRWPLTQPDLSGFTQVHPIGLYYVNISPETRGEPKKSITVTTGMSNTFNPQTNFFKCQPTGCSQQRDFGFEAWSPYAPDRVMIYMADGVIHSARVKFTQPLGKTTELQLGFNIYQLVKGDKPWDYLASDSLINSTHRIIGNDDPHGREQRYKNVANIWLSSYVKGHDQADWYEIKANQVYLGTFDVSAVKFIKVIDANDRILSTINFGVHTGIPMNRINPYVPIGASINSSNTFRVGDSSSITIAGGGSIINNRLIKLPVKQAEFLDDPATQKTQTTYHAAATFNKETAGRKYTTGLMYQGKSRIMNGDNYRSQGSYSNVTSDVTKPLKGVWQSSYSVLDNNESVSLFFKVEGKKSKRSYAVLAQEDGKFFTYWHGWQWGPEQRNTSNPVTGVNLGNNASDFAVYFQITQGFNWGKR